MAKSKETVIAGLRATEEYKAECKQLLAGQTVGGVTIDLDPLIARMNAKLNGLGFESVESFWAEVGLYIESASRLPRLKTMPMKILRVRSISHDDYTELIRQSRVIQKDLVGAITIGGQASHSVIIPADVDPSTLLDVGVCEENNVIINQDTKQCGVYWSDRGGVNFTIRVEVEPAWNVQVKIAKLVYEAQRAALESLGGQGITQQQAFMDDGELTERTIGICVNGRKVGVIHEYDKPKSWVGELSTIVCFTYMSLTMDYDLMLRAIRGVSNATELMLDEVSLETQIGRVVSVDEYVNALLPHVSRAFDVEFQEVTLSELGL